MVDHWDIIYLAFIQAVILINTMINGILAWRANLHDKKVAEQLSIEQAKVSPACPLLKAIQDEHTYNKLNVR